MKKKVNIVLIAAVLGLWGTIIYRTASQYFFPENVVSTQSSTAKGEIRSRKFSKDTFALQAVSRDPFLNKVAQRSQSQVSPVPMFYKPKVKTAKTPVDIEWPQVSYHGYIQKEKKQLVVLLRIGTKVHKIRENESAEGIKVRTIYHDSVQVTFQNDKKTIPLHR